MTYAVVVAAVVAAGLLARALLLVVTVVGSSMEPTYHHGDRVLVLRVRRLAVRRRAAVVVFAQARVRALARQPYGGPPADPPAGPPPTYAGPQPGRRSRADWLGRRRPMPDWLIKRVVARPGEPTPDAVPVVPRGGPVPAGHVVVYGDNGGVDSRGFGYLPLAEVRGVVIADLSTRAMSARSGER